MYDIKIKCRKMVRQCAACPIGRAIAAFSLFLLYHFWFILAYYLACFRTLVVGVKFSSLHSFLI